MASSNIAAKCRQKNRYLNVPSYDNTGEYGKGTQAHDIGFHTDPGGTRTRARFKGLASSAIKVGGFYKAEAGGRRNCHAGEIKFGEIGSDAYDCSLLYPGGCPALAGNEAKKHSVGTSGWDNGAIDSSALQIICEYDQAIFKKQDALNAWINIFETPTSGWVNADDVAANRYTRLHSSLMAEYCGARSKNCDPRDDRYGVDNSKPLQECSRFNAIGRGGSGEYSADDGGLMCRQWNNVAYAEGVPRDTDLVTLVGQTINTYCQKYPNTTNSALPNDECWCAQRNKDPLYVQMQKAGSGVTNIEMVVGCVWNPCTVVYPEQLRRPADDCPPGTDITICQQIISVGGNVGGDVTPEWTGQMSCGNDPQEPPTTTPTPPQTPPQTPTPSDTEPSDTETEEGEGPGTIFPGGSETVPLSEVDWSDVSQWPWWIWVVIAVGSVAVLGLLFFLLRPKDETGGSASASQDPAAYYYGTPGQVGGSYEFV